MQLTLDNSQLLIFNSSLIKNSSGTTTPGITTPTKPVIVNPVNGNQVFTNQVVGMVFVHSDHLGSVTMLTDGYGAVLIGGSSPGKSHIIRLVSSSIRSCVSNHKPYGEIHRTDSAGPDVIKYKYTGQEEDRETGLYYYKARYYDAALGRFISADSMDFKNKPMGMNRYMYVDGNPVMYTDPTGHEATSLEESMKYLTYVYILTSHRKLGFPHMWGHSYSGQGNNDHNSQLFNIKDRTKIDRMSYLYLAGHILLNNNESGKTIPMEHMLIFTFTVSHLLRTRSVSYMDWVSQNHDDEAPNDLGHFGGEKDSRQQTKASWNFVSRSMKGLSMGKINNLKDVGVFLAGVQIYAIYGTIRGIQYNLIKARKWLGKRTGITIDPNKGMYRWKPPKIKACKKCAFFGK